MYKRQGINTETFDGNKTAIKEAASVLESQGVKYRNLSIDSSSAAGKYASEIMAFPTTIPVSYTHLDVYKRQVLHIPVLLR